MTQKIKLMSDDEIKETVLWHTPFNWLRNTQCTCEEAENSAQWARDECESRAFEKIKEVAKWFWERSRSYSLYLDGYEYTNFEECLQQYLKEQDVKSNNEESKSA